MDEAPTRSGDYPIERRAGEIERLRIQAEALAPDVEVLLGRIGVGPGWRCLDLGCGPCGISGALSARVGPEGGVLGLDYDPAFVETASQGAPGNVTFMQGNAYDTGPPDDGFDLVHLRFLACTAGQPERLIAEALRLARPGGFVALQDADFASLQCHPPHPAWEALRAALTASFPDDDGEPVAQQHFRLLHQAGLAEVQYRPFVLGVRSGDPWADYLPATVESLRGTVTGRGLLAADAFEATLADCRAHLADPDTVFTSFTVVQAWGRKAAPSP